MILSYISLAKSEGSLCSKVCGTSGVGCLLFLCEDVCTDSVKSVLKASSADILDFNFDHIGVSTRKI
ncbi:MAG: hypothetical protein K0B02_02420 [DPANN group archaeon]|nr:hypothetical protein [DPANN group archaeon]